MISPLTTTTAPGRRLSVLIASQRETLTHALVDALRASGHQPLVQETAGGAIEALRSPPFDVLVVDGGLPGVDLDRVREALTGGARAAVLPPEPLEQVERRHIAGTLRYTRGNRRNAARLLGIARSTLLAKIRRYGLERDSALGGA